MKQLVALYRSPNYSPNQHRTNDTAIMDAVVARMATLGWSIEGITERAVAAGITPAADCYLNMCQGPAATLRLQESVPDGSVIVNRPEAVLGCHRYRLAPALLNGGIPFPATIFVDAEGPTIPDPAPEWLRRDAPIWVKRGDVHAECSQDVAAVSASGVAVIVQEFFARGIRNVALQQHQPGPIVKFYGVNGSSGTRFFRWYLASAPFGDLRGRDTVNPERLEALAFAAASVIGLEVFGGDAAVEDVDAPVLVDLNDWPSFAPVRDDAADAIAAWVHHRCSIPR